MKDAQRCRRSRAARTAREAFALQVAVRKVDQRLAGLHAAAAAHVHGLDEAIDRSRDCALVGPLDACPAGDFALERWCLRNAGWRLA